MKYKVGDLVKVRIIDFSDIWFDGQIRRVEDKEPYKCMEWVRKDSCTPYRQYQIDDVLNKKSTFFYKAKKEDYFEYKEITIHPYKFYEVQYTDDGFTRRYINFNIDEADIHLKPR